MYKPMNENQILYTQHFCNKHVQPLANRFLTWNRYSRSQTWNSGITVEQNVHNMNEKQIEKTLKMSTTQIKSPDLEQAHIEWGGLKFIFFLQILQCIL